MQISNTLKVNQHPFPYIVIDNFLDDHLAHQVEQEFPDLEAMGRHSADLRLLDGWQINPTDTALEQGSQIREMFKLLESGTLREQLAALFGLEQPLLCDPDYRGAGLLAAKAGGVHRIHRDPNRHPKTHFYRRLVLLLYFNPNWQPGHGGELNLWDGKIREAVTIPPLFNRCVIFENTRYAFHGISDVQWPEGMTRKALNFHYYTELPAAAERDTHIHNTEFFASPGHRLEFWRDVAVTRFPICLIDTAISRHEGMARLVQKTHLKSFVLQLKAGLLKRYSSERYQRLINSTVWDLLQKPNKQLIEEWREYNLISDNGRNRMQSFYSGEDEDFAA